MPFAARAPGTYASRRKVVRTDDAGGERAGRARRGGDTAYPRYDLSRCRLPLTSPLTGLHCERVSDRQMARYRSNKQLGEERSRVSRRGSTCARQVRSLEPNRRNDVPGLAGRRRACAYTEHV